MKSLLEPDDLCEGGKSRMRERTHLTLKVQVKRSLTGQCGGQPAVYTL